MKKTIRPFSYAGNMEIFRTMIAGCKKLLMRSRPLEQFPHYWALIPVEHKRQSGPHPKND